MSKKRMGSKTAKRICGNCGLRRDQHAGAQKMECLFSPTKFVKRMAVAFDAESVVNAEGGVAGWFTLEAVTEYRETQGLDDE